MFLPRQDAGLRDVTFSVWPYAELAPSPPRLTQNPSMTPEEANARTDLHVLDVREPAEWDAGHIAGAQHIPLGELRSRLADVPKGTPILAVCRHGNRSDSATRGLRTLGFTVENLDGGVTAWTKAGLPLEGSDGRPGRVI